MIYHATSKINYPLDGSLDSIISEMLGHEYFLVVTNMAAMNNKQGWVAAYIVPCKSVVSN